MVTDDTREKFHLLHRNRTGFSPDIRDRRRRTDALFRPKKLSLGSEKYCVVRRTSNSGVSEDLKDMMLLLLSYFDEKEDGMFCYVENMCLEGEVQNDQVQLTPTIVVCGRSCYSSQRFMLSVDRSIVHDNIPFFVSALCMMFGSYYCFNIHYPSKLASTLEFLQRCFFPSTQRRAQKLRRQAHPVFT